MESKRVVKKNEDYSDEDDFTPTKRCRKNMHRNTTIISSVGTQGAPVTLSNSSQSDPIPEISTSGAPVMSNNCSQSDPIPEVSTSAAPVMSSDWSQSYPIVEISTSGTPVISNDCLQSAPEISTSESLDASAVHRFPTFQEFEIALAQHEIDTITSYTIVNTVVNTKSTNFKETTTIDDICDPEHKMRWEFSARNQSETKDNLPIPFTGVPYIYLGKRTYECHQGRDRNLNQKKTLASKRTELLMQDHCTHVKTRKKVQSTKKLNCPVVFTVKKFIEFPSHKISTSATLQRRKCMSKDLRTDIAVYAETKDQKCNTKDHNIDANLVYMCCFPKVGMHKNHCVGELAGLIEPIDSRLADHLKQLIRTTGCRKTSDLRRYAESYVNETLLKGDRNPQQHRRRFTPSRKKLKNLLASVRMETQKSKLGQDVVVKLNAKWAQYVHKTGDIDTNVDESSSEEEDSEDNSDSEPRVDKNMDDSKICSVYQSPSMQRLYRKYGGHLVLLDTTCQTTKYSS